MNLKAEKLNSEQVLDPVSGAKDDTIAAIATPPGAGGVGIVRISGRNSTHIAHKLTNKVLAPRYATFVHIKEDSKIIDEGLAIFFKGPNSFTGEDVVELQLHGSSVVLNDVLELVYKLGARPATGGEFSKRAFLNNKIDLAQAEAISSIISASSKSAAVAAQQSLQGEFSKEINNLVDDITHTRVYLEASLDFSDEDIEHETYGYILSRVDVIKDKLNGLLSRANHGRVITDGVGTLILGPPNAGKSSLFNALSREDAAIVTNIAGTTRDLLRSKVLLNNIPLNVVDTAGIRETQDVVESKGIEKALKEAKNVELIFLVVSAAEEYVKSIQDILKQLHPDDASKVVIVLNKVDLVETPFDLGEPELKEFPCVKLSAKEGTGINELENVVSKILGMSQETEGAIAAKKRHIIALKSAMSHIISAKEHIHAAELCAEELKLAQEEVSKITGRFVADDLLGKIFSEFCIGK